MRVRARTKRSALSSTASSSTTRSTPSEWSSPGFVIHRSGGRPERSTNGTSTSRSLALPHRHQRHSIRRGEYRSLKTPDLADKTAGVRKPEAPATACADRHAAQSVTGSEWRRRESNPRPRSRENGFYERSRRSDLVPPSPRRPGCGGPARWRCSRIGAGGPPRVSLLSDPGDPRRRLRGPRPHRSSFC